MTINTPAATVEDHGGYLVAWKKVNGHWKAAVDIFNSDVAPPKQ